MKFMTGALVFVDTNILVYAHDSSSGEKHTLAQRRLRELLAGSLLPVVSIQVLQELYINLIRKGAPIQSAREIVNAYLRWQVINSDTQLLIDAMATTERWKISLWDSLIIAASLRANASVVWSEDLNDGQDYGGVRVINPLR